MKEFALKHPWLTFFMVDSVVCGTVKIVGLLSGRYRYVETDTGDRTEGSLLQEAKTEES